MRKTLYDVLELPGTASHEDIEASYRRLRDALQRSIDVGGEDARTRLVAVREAHQTLSHVGRRRSYDASLTSRESASAPAPAAAPPADGEHSAAGPMVFKGAIVLVLVALGMYGIASYRQVEAERLEKIRAAEAKKHAIEMDKLAIERAKNEVAATEQRRRLELDRQRLEESARQRRAREDQARVAADQELVRAQQVAAEEKMNKQRIDEQTRRVQEHNEQAERERKLRAEKEQLRRICRERYGREDC